MFDNITMEYIVSFVSYIWCAINSFVCGRLLRHSEPFIHINKMDTQFKIFAQPGTCSLNTVQSRIRFLLLANMNFKCLLWILSHIQIHYTVWSTLCKSYSYIFISYSVFNKQSDHWKKQVKAFCSFSMLLLIKIECDFLGNSANKTLLPETVCLCQLMVYML